MNLLSFTNYRDKAYDFIDVLPFQKEKFQRHLGNRYFEKNIA